MPAPVLIPPPVSQQQLDDLFPLPLSTMEAFMLADARHEYPMMADLELHFSGRIRREPFELALAAALARAPLFRSLVQVGPRGVLQWVPTQQPIAVEWDDDAAPLGASYDAPLDLFQTPGMRVYVRQGQESSSLLLHFHHACSDGIGGFAFIEDFLAAYAQAEGDDSVKMRRFEPVRLSGRGNLGTEGRSVYRGIADAFIGAREGARFFLQRPSPLPPRQSPAANETNRVRSRCLVGACSAETTAGLRQAATQLEANVNDLLVRDLFLTLDQWNRDDQTSSPRGQLRILMPQNLRERSDRYMPAGNMLGFAFVTRKRRQCRQPSELLRSVQEETAAVREGQLSRYFLGGLDTLQKAGLLPWVLSRNLCFSSAVLTNLGDPLRRFVTRFPREGRSLKIGDLRLHEITGVPPLRPNTRAAFCIFNSASQLKLCLRTDPYTYSTADTERLMELYISHLQTTATQAR